MQRKHQSPTHLLSIVLCEHDRGLVRELHFALLVGLVLLLRPRPHRVRSVVDADTCVQPRPAVGSYVSLQLLGIATSIFPYYALHLVEDEEPLRESL